MVNLTYGPDKTLFFKNLANFFDFQKRSQGRPPPLPALLSCAPRQITSFSYMFEIVHPAFAFYFTLERLGFWKVFDLIFIRLAILGFFCNICW